MYRTSFFYTAEAAYRLGYLLLGHLFLFGVLFTFSEQLLYIYINVFQTLGEINVPLVFIYTKVSSLFLTTMWIPLGIVVCLFPFWLFLQLWLFVAPGLYCFEQQFVFLSGFSLLALFYLGLFIIYYGFSSIVFSFFLKCQQGVDIYSHSLNIQMQLMIDVLLYTVVFITKLYFIIFCVLVVAALAIFIYSSLLKICIKWRYYLYLLFLILGGIISPPDVLSQLIVALLFIFIFETCLFWNLLFIFYKNYLAFDI